jgi:uracil-DNA glycosylase
MKMSFEMMLNSDWKSFLGEIKTEKILLPVLNKVQDDLNCGHEVFPDLDNIFRAFDLVSTGNLKVVILGQDPYHGVNQANGLSFSVQKETKLPPSLKNIYKEYKSDLNLPLPSHGDLSAWAYQGVLLLNSSLTVRKNQANSHKDFGWHKFTDQVISAINENKEKVVFILWGKVAEKKTELIDSQKHYIIKSSHPSPFSARKGFFGSQPFSKTNLFLKKSGKSVIDWEIK